MRDISLSARSLRRWKPAMISIKERRDWSVTSWQHISKDSCRTCSTHGETSVIRSSWTKWPAKRKPSGRSLRVKSTSNTGRKLTWCCCRQPSSRTKSSLSRMQERRWHVSMIRACIRASLHSIRRPSASQANTLSQRSSLKIKLTEKIQQLMHQY